MKQIHEYGRLTLIAIFAFSALVLFFLTLQESQAQVILSTKGGESIWFKRICYDSEKINVADSAIVPWPRAWKPKILKFKVQNAYPGYQLHCRLYLANVGSTPLEITQIQTISGQPKIIAITANQPASEKKVLYPCKFVPAWDTAPGKVPAFCTTVIEVTLEIGKDIRQNSNSSFSIAINTSSK